MNATLIRIDEELERIGKKKKDLCIAIGINTSTLSTWRSRDTVPNAKHLPAIADFLGVSVNYLLNGGPKNQHSTVVYNDVTKGVEKMAFRDRLKDLRTRKGLSQSEFADILGVSKSAISMYERGERNPDFETLEAIADFFNVDMNFLLGKDNGSVYYLDPEAAELAQEMYDRPEMKVLFDASRKATKEDIETVAELLRKLSKK